MNLDKNIFKDYNGYLEGTLNDNNDYYLKAKNYKKNITRNFISINPEQLERLYSNEYYVTRKVDGELNLVFIDKEDIFLVNTGGKIRKELPCLKELHKSFKNSGLDSIVLACELHYKEDLKRARVFDVLGALADKKEIDNIVISLFDILEKNDKKVFYENYDILYSELISFFDAKDKFKFVDYRKLSSKEEILELYSEWVDEENSEGLVIRSKIPVIYKLKPRHTIDAVVVGYTEGVGVDKGKIRNLLIALMNKENNYHVVAKVGGGFKDIERKEFYKMFSEMKMDSKYIETDKNYSVFHMVKPEKVVEVYVNDILVEARSSKIQNHILSVKDEKYYLKNIVEGVAFVYPIFVRFRDDKKADEVNTRFSQLDDLVYINKTEEKNILKELPKSDILLREVYKKEMKNKIMVQKFVVWKTNKEKLDSRYPSYVLNYTNYSSSRKVRLQSEVRISSSKEQIFEIKDKMLEKNVKKGWEKVQS
jgi:hypothetical protein